MISPTNSSPEEINLVNELFLEKMKSAIAARLRDLDNAGRASAEGRATVELDQQSIGRLSRMDALQQQAMARASQAMRQQEISNLHAALKRISEQEYGFCQDCGDAIEEARLTRAPTAVKCLDCARG